MRLAIRAHSFFGIDCLPVVQPVVSFDDAVEAYREIDEHPERSVKLGVAFR